MLAYKETGAGLIGNLPKIQNIEFHWKLMVNYG